MGDTLASVPATAAGMTVSLLNCTIRVRRQAHLQMAVSNSYTLFRYFKDNVVTYAAMSIFSGVALVTRTLFFGNTGEVSANVSCIFLQTSLIIGTCFLFLKAGAVSLLYHGKLALSNSCFAENNAIVAPGVVFIDERSLLALNDNNFGVGNDSTNSKCSAIFKQTGGTCLSNQTCTGNCIPFEASSCAAAQLPPLNFTRTPTPSIAPSIVPTPSVSVHCFSKWDQLSIAVRNAPSVGGIFRICPGSLLNVDLFPQASVTPIVIKTSNIVIQCGNLGDYNDKCTIYGGTTQFEIIGAPRAVKFKGLNLVGSQVTSINAFGSQNAQADFIGCTWAVSFSLVQIFVKYSMPYVARCLAERRVSCGAGVQRHRERRS